MVENVLAVSIGEIVVSTAENDTLVAYGLGSCVAVCLYDPGMRVGGMLHALLPTASNGSKVEIVPAKFVDQGIPILIDSLLQLGAKKDKLIVRLCGGAQMLTVPGVNNTLNIGQRNIQAAEVILKTYGLRIQGQATGGHVGRTVKMKIADGKVIVKTLGQGEQSLP